MRLFILVLTLIFSFNFAVLNKGLFAKKDEFPKKGEKLNNIEILDVNDKKCFLPSWGQKVLTIMYTDPDEKDINDDLSNAIKSKNYSTNKYLGIGVANCKDTWIPNGLIRRAAEQKQKDFPKSKILLDKGHLLSSAWHLGECNDAGVVIVLGKDAKVKFIKKITKKEQSKKIISEVIAIIDKEINKK